MKELFQALLIIVALGVVLGVLATIIQFVADLFSDSKNAESGDVTPAVPPPAPVSNKPNVNPVILLGGTVPVRPVKRPANLEFVVDYNSRLAGSSYFIVRVRGGPDGGRVGGITYAITGTVNVHQIDYSLRIRGSTIVNPAAFRGLYSLSAPLPEDDAWATLAVIPLDHVLPPKGGSFRYDFECMAYASAPGASSAAPGAVGMAIADARFATILNLPGPGYIDEIDWLVLRERLLGFIEGIVRGCAEDVAEKRSKVRSFVESLTPPVTSPARAAMLKVAIDRAYISAKPDSVLDYDVVEVVHSSKDAVLIEALARLTFHLASHEPITSEARKVFAMMRSSYDVNVNGYHIRDVDPLPPAVPVVTPVPTPKPAPIVPTFELKLESVEEAGHVKAVEVYVRGGAGSLLAAQSELSFWLWDENAGDNPFLVSAADIDLVNQRAVHHRTWNVGEYDLSSWQSAGVVRFSDFLPPSGGSRRISVAGKIGPKHGFNIFDVTKTSRSTAVTLNLAAAGYASIRSRRQWLRYRAFVLAVGQALLSGKGPTYRQDKALKKFADQLCAGITDTEWAKACRDELLVLIDSKVDDTYSGLTRLVDQLSTEAYPELKNQLLEALVEITASRQKRTKESRDFLEYCRKVLV